MNGYLLALIIVVAVAAIGTVGVWLVHTFAVQGARKELQAYRQQVVALSDTIDALKERHKILPYLEGKFTVPMTGETLAAYTAVTDRLEQHRRAWLKLMDVWEQSQSLLESESMFGNRRARSARRNLRAAGAPAEMATLLAECQAPLTQIENAHAQAGTDLNAYQHEDQKLAAELQSLAAAALAIAPYEPDRLAARNLVERAKEHLAADPLATLRCLGEARNKMGALERKATKILEQSETVRQLLSKLAGIQELAAQRRSQGFLLEEQGSNPEPLLNEFRQHHAKVQEALNQANETVVATILSKAAELIERSRQGIEQHVAAKLRCDTEIPTRRTEVRRLSEDLSKARGQQAELSRDFAPETWTSVAENVQRAVANLSAADQYLAEAAGHAAANVQHYVLAGKVLDKVSENHKQAETEFAGIARRLRELVETRGACQTQIEQLRHRSDRVNQLLQSSPADRALANERFRAARLAYDRLVDDTHLQRPDWTRLITRAKEIDVDLERVEQLAKQDIQLAQQASTEIAQTEKAIHEARSFSDQGITADITAAESQLSQARGCLTAQGYEEAIRLANAAEQMARTAVQAAISRAGQRRQDLESARLVEQAAATPRPILQAEAETP